MRRNIYSKKTTGALTNMDLKSTGVKIAYWCFYITFIAIALVAVFPIIWLIVSSFKDMSEFYQSPPTIIPKSFNPSKVSVVWEKMGFAKYYLNSAILAGGDIAFCIFFNGIGGYVLSRLQPRGTKFFLTVILWTMMIPSTATMVPLFETFIDFPYLHLNLINTYFPMWLIAGANAFYLIMFKNFFDSISKSLIEAANIDGCSVFGIFVRIVLPLSRPFLFVMAILTFNYGWGDFLYPYLILKDVGLRTVSLALYINKVGGGIAFDEYLIAVFLSVIPPMILFLAFNKQIMVGVNIGGVKG